jgi:hypothetical protein
MSPLRISLFTLTRELRQGKAFDHEYAIFGSTALILRDIIHREPGDIDVFVTRRLWGTLLARPGWVVETPAAGDPPILSYKATPLDLNLFFDWRDEMVSIDVDELLSEAESVDYTGMIFRCATVEEVLRQKHAALKANTEAVKKHIPDIVACLTWLERRNRSEASDVIEA